MKERIEYIDWARGYAILTIVCYHALQRVELPAVMQQAIVFGGTGVHLFFLLSGFGLALSNFSGSAVPFYERRLVRVWLPYVLVLTISWLAAECCGLFSDGFDAWLAGAGLYQMFAERYIESFGGHFWFISAIIQFYLAYPALVWLKTKLDDRLFFSLALTVSVIWWLTVYFLGKGESRTWNSCFLQFLWEFALGMTLAESYKIRNPKSEIAISASWWLSLPIALLFTALMALMILKMGNTGRIFNDIPALISYAAFSVFFFQVGEKFFPPLKRFFLWVGSFSYSLYLVHILVLEMWLQILGWSGVPVNGLNLLPFVALALVAGRLFEPLSRWWAGFFQRKAA